MFKVAGLPPVADAPLGVELAPFAVEDMADLMVERSATADGGPISYRVRRVARYWNAGEAPILKQHPGRGAVLSPIDTAPAVGVRCTVFPLLRGRGTSRKPLMAHARAAAPMPSRLVSRESQGGPADSTCRSPLRHFR